MIKRSLLQPFQLFRQGLAFSQNKDNPTVYKRVLPKNLISLNSNKGKIIFKESLEENNLESFFSLCQYFLTQQQPTTCGSATLAMVLNSLKVDPEIRWKGIWRWYDDFNIKSMTQQQVNEGITMEQYHQLAQSNGTKSMLFSPKITTQPQSLLNPQIKKSSIDLFRSCIISCCRRTDLILTANFHRKSLGQTGTGHFAPLSGYNSSRDMVLILQVAKFKYESYWCSVQELYESLKPIDNVTQLSRGFIINKKQAKNESNSSFCWLQSDWQMNQYLKKATQNSIDDILNDLKIHPLLIPILYEFYLSNATMPFIDQKYINQILNRLNKDAIHLLATFSSINGSISETLAFLLLILNKDQQNKTIKEKQTSKMIKKAKHYLNMNFIPKMRQSA